VRPGSAPHPQCNEGYQSSLAAANLKRLGFDRATDLAGGFRAWADRVRTTST
jgi:rhodanese-related sulfurtransferase